MTSVYAERRQQLYQRLGPRGVAIVQGAREIRRNGTNTFRFRQASDFLYLTGFEEPDAIAVFTPGKAKRFTIFLKPRDLMRENWTGKRLGVEEAEALGADQAFSTSELDAKIGELIDGCDEVFIHSGEDVELDGLLIRTLRRLRQNERNGSRSPHSVRDLALALHELRLVKDDEGFARMRRAAAVTAEAHVAAMRAARAGRREYEIEALIDYVFRTHDGCCGYDTIVGCGNNATTLHYTGGRDTLQAGQILLVDAGCEVQHYTADVTRSYPIGDSQPSFTTEQRRLYELVLASQAAGIAAAKPGATIEDVHDACVRVATAGLVELGLLEGDPAELIAKNQHRCFYVHRTSHFLGMDVHDVGSYFPGSDGSARRLTPGMVFTVEPGLYIRHDAELPAACAGYRGLGIRIEDDILITEGRAASDPGHEVLTREIPKDPDELLRIVGSGITITL